MDTTYINVHFLGNSTLDNYYGILDKQGSNAAQAKTTCIEGQLQKKLSAATTTITSTHYEIRNHAYDGLTAASVHEGIYVGQTFNIGPGQISKRNQAYLHHKKIIHFENQEDFKVSPLKDLRSQISNNPRSIHYVVISLASGFFKDHPSLLPRPNDWISAKKYISTHLTHFSQLYLGVLKVLDQLETTTENDEKISVDIRPILILPCRPKAGSNIYAQFKLIGIMALTTHLLGMAAMSAFAISFARTRTLHRYFFMAGVLGAMTLAASHQIVPLKATKNVLRGQPIDMATFNACMERLYRPILAYAQHKKIPLLDLANGFNPYDSELYDSQSRPSLKGGDLIAEGMIAIINHHNFAQPSKLYCKLPSESSYNISKFKPDQWQVLPPSKN